MTDIYESPFSARYASDKAVVWFVPASDDMPHHLSYAHYLQDSPLHWHCLSLSYHPYVISLI